MSNYEDYAVDCVKRMILRTVEPKRGITNRTFQKPLFLRQARTNMGGRIDLAMEVEECEERKSYVFEIKSCKSDVNSNHGMNFVGDVNFVVKPSEEMGIRLHGLPYQHKYCEADLHEKGLDDVGILVVNEKGEVACYRSAHDRSMELWLRFLFPVVIGDSFERGAHHWVSKEAMRICEKRVRNRESRWRQLQPYQEALEVVKVPEGTE